MATAAAPSNASATPAAHARWDNSTAVATQIRKATADRPTSAEAKPAVGSMSLVTWIHSNARVDPATHVGEIYYADHLDIVCWVTGDGVDGDIFWDMVFDWNTWTAGFVNEHDIAAFYDVSFTFCGDTGTHTSTFVSPVWQHNKPGAHSLHVGDVGGTSDLRAYWYADGVPYPTGDSSPSWWLVFDPSVYNGVAGFAHCSDLAYPVYCQL
jgi:hypothetical protein